jgi:condensin-2 complex subunit H2
MIHFLLAITQLFLCSLTEFVLIVKTFEELCRGHIEAFARGAENFALNTKLTERVRKWQEKLTPILEEEEQRASFDIHKYSETLIQKALKSLQSVKRNSDRSLHSRPSSMNVSFKAVTRGCSQSDVCRFFLASLSLANAGNLEVQEADEYCFLLISNKLEKPMESFRAPSQGAE